MARALAETALAGRLRIGPRAILCAFEVLTACARERVRRAFAVDPFDVYAATEAAGIASECELHVKHLYEDLVVPEVVDEADHPAALGEPGARLLVSVLGSRSIPLIRYEITDRVVLAPGDCACGRPYGVVERMTAGPTSCSICQRPTAAVDLHPNVVTDLLDPLPARSVELVERDGVSGALVEADEGRSAVDVARTRETLLPSLRARGAAPRGVKVRVERTLPRTAAGKVHLVRRAEAVA